MRKIKNYKKNKVGISKEEIYKQINIGLDAIRTACDEEVYEKFYLLHLDSSPVIEEAFEFINHGYRIKLLNSGIKRGDYNVLRTNVNNFVNNYLHSYQPTELMGLYCLFFVFNKWIYKYIKLNEYKKIFKKENSLKKEKYKEIYTLENYKGFDKLFKLNITKNDEIDPAYPKDWMTEFKHISELLKWNLAILDKYREKLYEPKLLKKYINKYIDSAILVKDYIPKELDKFFESKLVHELEKLLALIKSLLKSKQLILEMIRVKKPTPEEVSVDIKYIKNSIIDIENFINKLMYLLITGDSITNPSIVKQKLKQYKLKVS